MTQLDLFPHLLCTRCAQWARTRTERQQGIDQNCWCTENA
jgi:hypothetical protein